MIRGDPNRYGMVMECAGGSRRVLESAGSMRVRYILDLLDPPYPSRFSWTLPNLISFKTLKALLKLSQKNVGQKMLGKNLVKKEFKVQQVSGPKNLVPK